MIRAILNATAIAFMFLTRIPMPRLNTISPEDQGRALLCFPLVGLCIGALLSLCALYLPRVFSIEITAALILGLWIFITGALHLDGLADSADAWLSGTSGERALEIMKDPRCGSAAVATLVFALLIKYVALTALIEHQAWWALLIAPIIGRCCAPLILLSTPYVNPQGIGLTYIEQAPTYSRTAFWIIVTASGLGLYLLSGAKLSVVVGIFFISLIIIAFLRRMMMQRLGGTNGDTAGATVEISEILLLVGASALL
ncbi:adenosylcobinamide-GDP ribazoletransferase [Maricurvus nonylphenolicus]|uniref:adenosylcobinamide-GDP ribazoletransferase n=1 Tax=Maricurvus nonylphenolicus TaxID=1008307 RepID=UPI0036F3A2AF